MLKPLRKLPLLMLVIWSAGLMPPARAQVLTALNRGLTKQRSTGKESSRQSLVKILTAFEKQHNVTFNYDSELLLPIVGDLKALEGQTKNIDESLTKLLATHQLTFEKISANDYIIIPVRPQPKPVEKPLSKPSSGILVDKIISGKVTSAKGEGLPGVTVLLKGTSVGATTGSGGDYTLSVPDAGGTLIFSFIGFATKEVAVPSAGGTLNVSLEEDAKALEEVVVVGYGTQQKKDITGAVSTIDAKDVGERRAMQVSEALQGSVPGVTVTRNSGAPGATSTIRLRGITTIGENNPLIIIDGVPNDNINNVNPNDIESITVLKDAASAAIYGSRAAAGVILVTTKRAKTGQSSLEYNYEYGVQTPTQLPEYVDVVRYMQLFNEYQTNDGGAALYSQQHIENYRENNRLDPDRFPATDWQNAVLKSYAPRQMHDLSFTIGTEKIRTKASLSYAKVDGLYDNRAYDRYTVRINNDMTISKSLNANFDLFYKRTHNQEISGENPIYASRVLPGFYDDKYEDGRWAPGKDGRNPLAQIYDGGFNEAFYNQMGGRLAFNFKPINDLSLTAIVSPTLNFDKSKVFSKVIQFADVTDPGKVLNANQANTTLTEGRPESRYINGQLLANYSKNIREDHQLDALLGYEENYYYSEGLSASRGSFTITNFPFLDVGNLELRNNSGDASESALRSVFSRLKYSFRDKYYIQGNVRYDGSSRFHEDRRWALFPSFSAGWTISEESFLKNFRPLSFLKIRGSWGVVGNERIGNYPYQSSIQFYNALFYRGNQISTETTGAQVKYAVENITWETTQSVDFGLDAGFLGNRLSLTADVYDKKTRDILLALDIPRYLGYDNPNQNAGMVSARGWELAIGWRDKIGQLGYSVNLNLSDAKTKIVDLKGTQMRGDQAQLEGGEFSEWFGYKSAGLFQTAEEVKNSPVLNNNTKPGDIRYVDINEDGKITPEGDKILLGGSLPRYIYGGNIRLDFKGLDFTLVLQGVGKVKRRLGNNAIQPFLENFGNVPAEIDGNFWSLTNTPEQNLSAKYPRLSKASEGNNYQMSDYWLMDGSYLRIKNLTLGYNLPEILTSRIRLQGLRVYVAANDLKSFSKFPKGWDPEVDGSTYPIVTTLMGGLSVKF
ncbi:MAG: SusC/RagA family TonB-linked outer membrane protein [Adhaeribacter sp.]